jgi:putative hydrolases of HD superfamily
MEGNRMEEKKRNSAGDLASIAKNSIPWNLIRDMDASPIVAIYFKINHLKQLFRRGYLRRNRVSAEKCESVAEHCFGMLVLAWFIISKKSLDFDLLKIFKLIIAHEFGEIYAGDITVADNISRQEKFDLEKSAVQKLFEDFPDAEEYVEAWAEYSAKATPEAIFVSQIDKLEMAFQASIYQLQYEYEKDFTEFIAGVEEQITDPVLREIYDELSSIRFKFKAL